MDDEEWDAADTPERLDWIRGELIRLAAVQADETSRRIYIAGQVNGVREAVAGLLAQRDANPSSATPENEGR